MYQHGVGLWVVGQAGIAGVQPLPHINPAAGMKGHQAERGREEKWSRTSSLLAEGNPAEQLLCEHTSSTA